MKKTELIIKSREAMMSAVQIYNNPQITFKSETFITLSIIAWTYLLHAYYANEKIDYRYFHMNGKRKIYDKTKYGAFKHWELERCLDDRKSPIDAFTTQNLKFLIGLRHEIEHQMTKKIDSSISAKLQACSINYNFYIKKLFGNIFGVDQELGMAIQFSPIEAEQKNFLLHNEKIADNVTNFITSFEDNMSDDEMGNTHYAYRVVFARVDGKRINGETDEVIKFLPADSPEAQGINAKYALIKETEKKKYLSKEIVDLMHSKGYGWFNIGEMTSYWKNILKSRDKYGIYITKSQWMWYENWIPVMEKYCQEKQEKIDSKEEKTLYPKDVVEEMKKRGYSRFNAWWFNKFWEYELEIDKNDTIHGYFGPYNRFVWKESILPFVEELCKKYESRLK
jgi:hypothetical protein